MAKKEIVIDHFNGNNIFRPFPNATKKYDFDFRKKGSKTWRYINSADTIEEFSEQIVTVLKHNGEYRIIEDKTNKVVKKG